MVNYIYSQRTTKDLNPSNQRSNIPIIHTNTSTYAQARIQFHKFNPVQENSSHKRLKLQFNENFTSTKMNATQEIPQTIHIKSANKLVSLINSKEPNTFFQQKSTL